MQINKNDSHAYSHHVHRFFVYPYQLNDIVYAVSLRTWQLLKFLLNVAIPKDGKVKLCISIDAGKSRRDLNADTDMFLPWHITQQVFYFIF